MAGFFTWIAEGLGLDSAEQAGVEARSAELDAQREREAGLVREPETYFGTTTPVRDPATGSSIDPETGRAFDRTVSGTETRSDEGFGWSWLTAAWQQITGTTTTVAGVDDVRGREVTAVAEDRTTRTISPAGSATYEHVDGVRTEVLDASAMAADARGQLEGRRDLRREEHERVTGELAALEREREGAPPERHAELDRRREELAARQARLATEVRDLERDIAVLAQDNIGERGLLRITEAHGLEVRPQYTTDTEHRETTSAGLSVEGVGLAGEASHETRDVADGRTTTTTYEGEGSVDLLGASLEGSLSASHAVEEDGVTRTATSEGSGSLTASEGTLTGTLGRSDAYTEADEDGNVALGAATSSSSSVGMIASEDELGVAVGSESERSITVDGRTVTRADEASTRVTDHGVAHEASTDRSVSSSRTADGTTTTWRGGARTSRSGSFTVDVEPIEGSVPPQYRVTMALSAGAGLTLSGSAGRSTEADAAAGRPASSVSGSASGGASGSVGLTYRHVMSEAEAQQYMLEADQAEDEGAEGSHPEFGLVSRLRALVNEGDNAAAGGLAVLGSSSAAAGLGEGESIELTLTGTISGEASIGGSRGAFGGSLEASGSLSATRTVRVAHVGDAAGRNLVEVTITFVDASSHRAGGSATIEGVTAGGAVTGSDRDSESATARLDTASPSYEADYHTLCAATSIDEVRDLATRFTTAHTETRGGEATVGALGAELTMGSESTMASSVTTGAGGTLTGEFSGGVTDSAAISVADTDVLQATDRNTAVASVDEHGLDVRLEHEEAESDVLRSLSEGWASLTEWWGGEHDAADVAQAVATSPEERLREQLEETYSRLEEYALSEADVDVLAGRARNTTEWGRCAHSHRVRDAWAALRGALTSPSPDPEWTRVNPENANRLARARAIAQFMAASGDDGMEAMEHCLRRWGEGFSTVSTAADVGVYREWPNSILEEREKLLTARSRIRGAEEHLVGLIGRSDGLSRAEAWRDDTATKLDEVERAVAGCADFEHPRAKLEMLDEIARLRRELSAAWERNLHALETGVAETPMPADEPAMSHADGREAATAAPEVCTDPALAPLDELAAASTAPPTEAQVADRARMTDLVGMLRTSKSEEAALFTRARGMIRADLGVGGTIEGTWDYMWSGDETGAVLLMSEVADLHEAWISRVVELREVYGRLGIPAAQWIVSTGPGAPRSATYEPDVDTLIQLYTLDYGGITSSLSLGDRRGVAAQWRRRVTGY